MVAKIIVTGHPIIDRKLKDYEPRLQRKLLRSGMRRGTKLIQKEIKRLAPRGETGTLQKKVSIRAMKRKKGRIGFIVGSSAAMFTPYYAAFVNFGTKLHSRGSRRVHRRGFGFGKKWRIRPRHFMEDAYKNTKELAKSVTVGEIIRLANETTKELSAK